MKRENCLQLYWSVPQVFQLLFTLKAKTQSIINSLEYLLGSNKTAHCVILVISSSCDIKLYGKQRVFYLSIYNTGKNTDRVIDSHFIFIFFPSLNLLEAEWILPIILEESIISSSTLL